MTPEERVSAEKDAGSMPLHNLLRHVAGYVTRGCAACDWLLRNGHITEGDCYE